MFGHLIEANPEIGGISHWTVSAKEVEVTEVTDTYFVVTGNKQVPLKKSASKIDTIEKLETIRSDALDRYDTGPWTEKGTTTRKVKESYGDGVYPASFLLKFYNNTKKSYSIIGGGGSYSGPDFETLKAIAQTEKFVQKVKATSEKYEMDKNNIAADDKDIQRIYDILTKSNVQFHNYFDFSELNKFHDATLYTKRDLNKMYASWDGHRKVKEIEDQANTWKKMFNFTHWYYFTFPDRLHSFTKYRYTFEHCPEKITIKQGLQAPLVSKVEYDEVMLKKLVGKMAKQITDIPKLQRRIAAIKDAITLYKEKSNENPDKNYVFCSKDKLPELVFEFNSVKQILENINSHYPSTSFRPALNAKDKLEAVVYRYYDFVDNRLSTIEKTITEIFEGRLKELQQLL